MTFKPRLILAAALLATLSVYACVKTSRTLLAPPEIPGAEFVGSEECADCHPDVADRFATATHSLLLAKGENAKNIGCESCHGAASLHTESGGERGTIINPRKSPEICFQCHIDKRADFALPYAHPLSGGPLGLTTGRVSCSDCHESHSGSAVLSGGTAPGSMNATCIQCHAAQRGPWVYEHEALREGCTVCHQPHGSPNDKMLTERNATLCLKCHFQEQVAGGQIVIGGQNHAFLDRGTCWSAGCHEAVHGSNVNSSLRY
jgi:predicted CXXCH cytochrome family protein